jgi:hypothetical protein
MILFSTRHALFLPADTLPHQSNSRVLQLSWIWTRPVAN